jgi:cell wall-associated NlpC family hydrolase
MRRLLVLAVLLLLPAAPAAAQNPAPVPSPGAAPVEVEDLPDAGGGEETGAGAPLVPPAGPPAPVPPAAQPQPEPEPLVPPVELVRTRTVAGREAKLRTDGLAAIPRGAPKRVRTLIAAFNRIIGKPYVWGGGHARLIDRGYDCSGAVSYGLIGAGLLAAPQVSGALARWGARGPGRWITVFANAGHAYLEVAGLRLDTSAVGDVLGGGKGVRWRPAIGKRPTFSVRHPLGL